MLFRSRRSNAWLWLQWGERLWLLQRPGSGVWAGLWSLPEFDTPEALDAASADWPGTPQGLPMFTHVLTHLDWTLQPVRWTLPVDAEAADVAAITATLADGEQRGDWVTLPEALAMGLPAPLRKLLTSTPPA